MAAFHDDQPVDEFQDRDPVGRHDQRLADKRRPQSADDRQFKSVVHSSRRLVEQQQVGPCHQGACHRHHLALASRQGLAAHPDADADKVGCIGASYGGFLTMHLVTQTDMFAAAVSHAGISSISSYWAEGYWGYGYGARALANSFPWSDPELYVGQSPLFHADAITTPLLLLHGFDDTNVPKGESDGLYIALTMLGRDVEYVQIAGQDHHILDHDKRIRWNDTILAYFDWKLKGQDGWWKSLHEAKP